MPLTEAIKQQIQTRFGPQSDEVVRILERYGTEDWHPEIDRVHEGILELAKDDINSVKKLVDEATRDYRNILYWLQFDEIGNPPPLPTVNTDRTPKTPPDIPPMLRESDITLAVLESPEFQPQEVAVNPCVDDISHHVHRLPWNEITFVVAQINDDYWLEGSGSLKPEDGLSSVCFIDGKEYVILNAPESLDELVALLDSFARKDGQWRTMVEWC